MELSQNMNILNIGIKKIFIIRQGIKNTSWKFNYNPSERPEICKTEHIYSITYVKSGGIKSHSEEGERTFDEGCIYIEQNPDIEFSNFPLNIPTHIYVATFSTYEEIPIAFPKDGRIKIYPHSPESVERKFIQLYDAFSERSPLWSITASRFLLGILESFFSAFFEKSKKKKIPAFLKTCVNYINEHAYSETVNIDSLAHMCNVSTNHLLRVFKSEYGISPKKYINNLKVERAAEYLIATDLTIGEICEKTGFNDFSYFCRTFKSRMGTSPSEYREISGDKQMK